MWCNLMRCTQSICLLKASLTRVYARAIEPAVLPLIAIARARMCLYLRVGGAQALCVDDQRGPFRAVVKLQ